MVEAVVKVMVIPVVRPLMAEDLVVELTVPQVQVSLAQLTQVAVVVLVEMQVRVLWVQLEDQV